MKRLTTLHAITLLAGSLSFFPSAGAGAAEVAFPAAVDVRVADGEVVVDLGYTLDGEQAFLYPGLIPDIDGDGQVDSLFVYPDEEDCNVWYLAKSGDGHGRDFQRDTLSQLVALVNVGEFQCLGSFDVRVVSDINGDGLDELVFTKSLGSGLDTLGSVVLFGGFAADTEIDVENLSASQGFLILGGKVTSSAGDINGDGFNDLVLKESGTITRILAGRGTGFPAIVDFNALSASENLLQLRANSRLNSPVKPAGDLDGDGLDDLIIDSIINYPGIVVYGKDIPALDLEADTVLQSARVIRDDCGSTFGSPLCRLSPAGDIDGDGFDDIYVYAAFPVNEGRIIYGSVNGVGTYSRFSDIPDSQVTSLVFPPHPSQNSGEKLIPVGDINADGLPDVSTGDRVSNAVIFGRNGQRVPSIDIAKLDGSDGFRWHNFPHDYTADSLYSTDANSDGLPDLIVLDKGIVGGAESTRPLSPSAVTLLTGPESIDMQITPASDASAASYQIEVNGNVVASIAGTESNFRLDNVDAISDAIIGVRALDASGISSPPFVLWAVESRYPPVPGLRANIFGPFGLELFWSSAPGPYTIYRNGEFLSNVNGGSYTDVGLTPGTSYTYYVTYDYGRRAGGDYISREALDYLFPVQARSAYLELTTPTLDGSPSISTAPGAPQDLRFQIYSDTAAEIFWSEAIDDQFVFSYEVSRNGEVVVTRDARSYFDATLDAGTEYTYSVVAIDLDGNRSPAVSVTLNSRGSSNSDSSSSGNPPVSGTPSPAEEVRALVYSTTAGEIFWSKALEETGFVNYEVSRDGVVLTTGDVRSYFDSTLTPGTEYNYSIVALDRDGGRSPAVSVTLTTNGIGAGTSTNTPVNDAPEPAENPVALVYSSTAGEVTWIKSQDEQGFVNFEVSRDGQVLVSNDARSYFDSTLAPATEYTYTIVAVDQSGARSPEVTVSLTTRSR